MNRLTRGLLERALRSFRRVKERAGLVSGFADMEMHLWMLTDTMRTGAFEQAIASHVRAGDVVADVGAGTGLLSFMAARCGASRVYAIEEREVIDLARRLAGDNHLLDRIIFMKGRSTALTLPEKVDVIVSETIGAFVFSEDITSILPDARARFLRPGGAMIPDRIVIRIAPIESFREGVGFWESPVRGFDFRSAAACFDHTRLASARALTPQDLLAPAQVLYDLDFMASPEAGGFARELTFAVARAGTLHGFAGTWEASTRGQVFLRCEPESFPVNWAPSLFRLPRGVVVSAGDRVALSFRRQDRPGWHWRWDARVA